MYPWRFRSATKEICNFSWLLLWTAKENVISLSAIANRQGNHLFKNQYFLWICQMISDEEMT
jgi:hypothetical protein